MWDSDWNKLVTFYDIQWLFLVYHLNATHIHIEIESLAQDNITQIHFESKSKAEETSVYVLLPCDLTCMLTKEWASEQEVWSRIAMVKTVYRKKNMNLNLEKRQIKCSVWSALHYESRDMDNEENG